MPKTPRSLNDGKVEKMILDADLDLGLIRIRIIISVQRQTMKGPTGLHRPHKQKHSQLVHQCGIQPYRRRSSTRVVGTRYTLPVFTDRVGKKHCTTMLFSTRPQPVLTGVGTHYLCSRPVNTGCEHSPWTRVSFCRYTQCRYILFTGRHVNTGSVYRPLSLYWCSRKLGMHICLTIC